MHSEAEEFQKAQHALWNEYVAVQPIDIGGARAFNVGDPVPKTHVEAGLVPDDAVARRTTKAAQAVTGEKD